ncbi:Gfo/Idh/MocA family protein [Microbacterium sp. I2]|jgi:predicted dehydrogenase|uniref:Gfo/Idh/MocA family protein n=1 Tax=Microbacterium sp. I2 TaxID=3391826 RepID=UPI003EDB1782
MTDKLRLGLIGTGWVANQHMAGARSVAADDLEVTAACDPRREVLDDFCDRHGIGARFASAGELISSGAVDAVVLLTPPAVRHEVIDPALEHGLHVLVEKPFGENGHDAVTFTESAEAARVTMAVSQNFRWFPEYTWLRDRLGRPDAGGIDFVEARTFQNRPQAPGAWRAEETKLEMAIFSVHLIDRVRWIARTPPVSVRAVTRRRRGSSLMGEQFSSLLIEFAGGVVGTVTSSWTSRTLPLNTFRVDTDLGSASVERTAPMSGDATGTAHFGAQPERLTFAETQPGEHAALSYGSSLREFAVAIAERRSPQHSARDNLQTMGIMEAAYRSAARGGTPVTVEEALYGHVAYA